LFLAALNLGGLSGCAIFIPQTVALRDSPPAGIAQKVELAEVPFFPQEDYQCGPAALATVLAHRKLAVTPDDLVSQVYVPERKGSLQVEMLAAARRRGMVAYPLAPRMEDMLREIAAGNPVLVLQDIGIWPFENWHYAVAVGYDLGEGEVVLRSGVVERRLLPIAVHEYAWRKSGYWAMVAIPPERIPATASEPAWLAALAAFERVNAKGARGGYTAFLGRWPENVDAMVGLANAHHAAGELKDAEAALRRAYQRQPDSVVVQNNLAQTLSDQGRHDEALPYAERAAKAGGPFAAAAKETLDLIRARAARKP
jgi:tetratricopeptide (TPR) repeat protein